MARPDDGVAALYLAAIVQSSDDAIVSKDLEGIIQSWNPAAERMFGYPAAEAVGRSIRMIIPPERQAEEDEVLSRIVKGLTVDHFETVRVRKDGSRIEISLTVSPIRTADGTVIGASKIARDISERKRAEAALARAETAQADLQKRLLTLVAASGTLLESPQLAHVLPATVRLAADLITADAYAVWQLADDGVWRVECQSGLSEEFTTQRVEPREALPARTAPFAEPLVADDVSRLMVLEERREAYAREGIRSMLAIPLSGGAGGAAALVFYYREPHAFSDVEVHAARALGQLATAATTTAQLYDEARQANRLKDEFLATLSHELRTPLNAILGYTRMLRSAALAADRRDKAMETVERNALLLAQIVDDVLDMSRIVAGKMRLKLTPTSLADVLHDAVLTLTPAAQAKGVRLEVHVSDDVGSVMLDPDRIQQVLWNLLANAVKFTPSGGSVELRACRANQDLELTVSDTGEGMAPEFLPHVFERFRQGETRSAGVRGLGLGLAIARHIVEMHGGTIEARSEGPGKGSTFCIRLPIVRAPAVV